MKKKYITPAVTTILIETSEIIAKSPTFDIVGEGNDDDADAASYRTTLWN